MVLIFVISALLFFFKSSNESRLLNMCSRGVTLPGSWGLFHGQEFLVKNLVIFYYQVLA